MRLVLTDFPWHRPQDPRLPLGHASLLAALRSRGTARISSVVIPANVGRLDPDEVAAELLAQSSDMPDTEVTIAVGAYVWSESLVQRVLPLLRARGFAGRIILGGPQISYAALGTLEATYPQADVFVRGQGEEALCALATDRGQPKLPGIHYAGTPDLGLSASADVDSLPSPLLEGTFAPPPGAFVRWETQRGCPFRCKFCQHRDADLRLVHRAFPDARVFREIDLLCERKVGKIAVLDPIFNTQRPAGRPTRILDAFTTHGFDGQLSLQCRAEYVDLPFLEAARQLHVVLEFGLQTIHDSEGDAVGRRNHLGRVSEVLAEVKRRDIDHEVSLIFGVPEQTLASFCESVRWCLERGVPVIKAFPLMLLRGTELEQLRKRWRLVEDRSEMPCVTESDSFTRDDWMQMARLAEALRRTEGRHPRHFDELLALAGTVEFELSNWQPVDAGER